MGSMNCAFCKGTGKDPFSILSKLATCQVCGGRGKNFVMDPMTKCHFCTGAGVQSHSRLTCTVCKGKGYIYAEKGDVCQECKGGGKSLDDSNLPCSACGGKGVG